MHQHFRSANNWIKLLWTNGIALLREFIFEISIPSECQIIFTMFFSDVYFLKFFYQHNDKEDVFI